MTTIEEQIKKLQRLKQKMNLYQLLKDNVSVELTSEEKEHKAMEQEFPGLMEEFCKEVSEFADNRIKALEAGDRPPPPQQAPRARPPAEGETDEAFTEPAPQKTKEEKLVEDVFAEVPTDPVRFAMKYRQYGGKKVVVNTPNGPVNGEVTRVSAPFLIVETETGHSVQVPPTDLELIDEGA